MEGLAWGEVAEWLFRVTAVTALLRYLVSRFL